MTNIAFDLSTHIDPPKEFTLDGEVYAIKGVDHLSANEEAKAMALFARHSYLAAELDETKNVQKGEQIATALRNTRLNIIYHLTTIPEGTPLPMHVQLKLIEAVREEMVVIEGEESEKPVDAAGEDAPVED